MPALRTMKVQNLAIRASALRQAVERIAASLAEDRQFLAQLLRCQLPRRRLDNRLQMQLRNVGVAAHGQTPSLHFTVEGPARWFQLLCHIPGKSPRRRAGHIRNESTSPLQFGSAAAGRERLSPRQTSAKSPSPPPATNTARSQLKIPQP